MSKLRKEFVKAIDNEQFEKAQGILLAMADAYVARGGFDTVEELESFETVVIWFDKEIVEKGLVAYA